MASPTFTGTPAAPTAAANTNTTQLATTAFVTTAVSNVPIITVGNTSAAVTDTGVDGAFTVTTEGVARLTINSSGAFGLGGSSFGTNGQVLTSAGSGSIPTWQTPPAGASILAGNTSATVTDTGVGGTFTVTTEGTSRFVINNVGAFGVGGSNFGTSGQFLVSSGSTSSPSWQTLSVTSISVGNTNATVTDTGTDGTFTVTTEGTSRLTIGSTGLVSISGNLSVTGTTTLTGIPTGPTAATNTNTTQLATTAFVANAISTLATLASPTFTGTPAAPTAIGGTNTTQIATTAFVAASLSAKADLAGPAFTGVPTAPTATAGTSTTQLATTAFVTTADNLKANLASPTFTGTVVLPSGSSVTASSQPAFLINSTAASSWNAELRFANSGTTKWKIGTDSTSVGNNNLYFYDSVAAVERARITSTGHLKVTSLTYVNSSSDTHELTGGTSISGAPLLLRNASNSTGYWFIGPYNTTGDFWIYNSSGVGQYMASGSQSWTGTSDERLKDIIEPISNALTKIKSLRTVIGKFKTDPINTRRPFLIAQDVKAVFPEAVDEQDDKNKTLGIAYTDMIPLLTAALKESLSRIEALENQVAILQAA